MYNQDFSASPRDESHGDRLCGSLCSTWHVSPVIPCGQPDDYYWQRHYLGARTRRVHSKRENRERRGDITNVVILVRASGAGAVLDSLGVINHVRQVRMHGPPSSHQPWCGITVMRMVNEFDTIQQLRTSLTSRGIFRLISAVASQSIEKKV